MDKKINVLVFPCGAENGIEIHTALKDILNISLFGASSIIDHAGFVFKNYIGDLPYITDKVFIKVFNSIIKTNSIDVVIPTHDEVALFLALNASKIMCKIAVPGVEQARICRSKKGTYNLFKDEDFCPFVYDSPASVSKYPVFAKPDIGQGGEGTMIINNESKLSEIIAPDKYVFTEYLPGEELTVDCFTDRHGSLRFIGPRKRNRVHRGISVNSFTVPLTNDIKYIAETISSIMKMRGLWFFQVKQDIYTIFKLMEISVRAAGTMNLYRGLGVNFPLLTVYDLMDYDINILINDYYLEVDRTFLERYKSSLVFDTIYIDFDDTIIKNGQVNYTIMLFLYNMKNSGKNIKLITRHETDLYKTLDKFCIHKGLFNSIIHLKPEDEKYKHITENDKVIFIDNAFKERAEVKTKLNIPVFDVDAVPTLIDWRE